MTFSGDSVTPHLLLNYTYLLRPEEGTQISQSFGDLFGSNYSTGDRLC